MRNKLSFTSAINRKIREAEKLGRYATAKSYSDARNSLQRYFNKEEIFFVEITSRNMFDYQVWLTTEGKQRNTISTYFRRIRYVYNNTDAAAKQRQNHADPFLHCFTGVESLQKKSVSPDTMRRLLSVKTSKPQLRHAQQIVILMLCFNGMPFTDIAHLKASNMKNGILAYHRQKTGKPMTLPVLPKAEEILRELRQRGEDAFLLPILPIEKGGRKGWVEYRNTLNRFNRWLAELTRMAGLDEKFTSYTVRHTFATTLKMLNTPIEMISELLGHKSIRTTQFYLRSFSLGKRAETTQLCLSHLLFPCLSELQNSQKEKRETTENYFPQKRNTSE